MSFSRFAVAVMLAAAATVGSGCADLSRGGAIPDGGDAGTSRGTDGTGSDSRNQDAQLSFASNIEQILAPTCQRCHAVGQQAGDTMLILTGSFATDYAAVALFIDLGVPMSSRLLAKMSGTGHGGGVVYAVGTPEYQSVLQWIQEGASP